MNYATIAWRNLGRNRRRSALSVTAVAVATLSIVLLFSLLEGMKSDLRSNLTTFYTGEVQIRHADYGTYEHLRPLHLSVKTPQLGDELAALPEVEAAVSRLTVPGAVFQRDQRQGLLAVGVEFSREQVFSAIDDYLVAGDLGSMLQWAPGDHRRVSPAVVGNRVLDRLGISLGEQFTVVARTAYRGTNAMTFRAAAVADFPVETLNRQAFWIPLERAQTLAQMPGQVGEILLRLSPAGEQDLPRTMTLLRDRAPTLELRHFSQMDTTYGLLEMASRAYNVIALFFFLLASTVVVNTTMMAIFERRREIGTLEALGMRGSHLIRLFLTESAMLGLLGATAGLALGVGLSLILGHVGIDLGNAMSGVDFEISPVLHPMVNLRSSVGVFVFSLLVTVATTYLPTRRITRIEPVAALREE